MISQKPKPEFGGMDPYLGSGKSEIEIRKSGQPHPQQEIEDRRKGLAMNSAQLVVVLKPGVTPVSSTSNKP